MKGYTENINRKALDSVNFREVVYTAQHLQLVVMSLLPSEEIGEEVHALDQFIRVEQGEGAAVLDGVSHPLLTGSAVVIPQGVRHNIINTSTTEPLQLMTIYSPPDHKDGIVHTTKAEAVATDAPFDGVTTE